VRVRRAEARAREILAESAKNRGASPAAAIKKPKPETVAKAVETPEPAPEVEANGDEAKPNRKGW